MNLHLINPTEVVIAGRPMGNNINEDRLLAYITEVEMMNIKPVLGDNLFHQLLISVDEPNDIITKLMSGGSYEYDGKVYYFAGLKSTISYYVFAQNVMSGDFQSTRYGMVLKDGYYSSHISSKERSDCYNNALEVANQYLNECVRYCRHKGLIQKGRKNTLSTGGITIRKIG